MFRERKEKNLQGRNLETPERPPIKPKPVKSILKKGGMNSTVKTKKINFSGESQKMLIFSSPSKVMKLLIKMQFYVFNKILILIFFPLSLLSSGYFCRDKSEKNSIK